jgi:hypothetical protein
LWQAKVGWFISGCCRIIPEAQKIQQGNQMVQKELGNVQNNW